MSTDQVPKHLSYEAESICQQAHNNNAFIPALDRSNDCHIHRLSFACQHDKTRSSAQVHQRLMGVSLTKQLILRCNHIL